MRWQNGSFGRSRARRPERPPPDPPQRSPKPSGVACARSRGPARVWEGSERGPASTAAGRKEEKEEEDKNRSVQVTFGASLWSVRFCAPSSPPLPLCARRAQPRTFTPFALPPSPYLVLAATLDWPVPARLPRRGVGRRSPQQGHTTYVYYNTPSDPAASRRAGRCRPGNARDTPTHPPSSLPPHLPRRQKPHGT